MVQLLTLRALIDEPNITRAASRAKSHATRVREILAELEDRFGGSIVYEDGQGFTPTPLGNLILEQARKILDLAEGLERIRNPGVVTIASSRTVGEVYLPKLIVRFQLHHPETKFEVRIDDSERVIGLVKNLQADIGFVGSEPSDATLTVSKVFRDNIVPFVGLTYTESGRHTHPLLEKYPSGIDSRELARLANERKVRFVLRGSGSATRETAGAWLQSLGCSPPILEDQISAWGSNQAVKAFVYEMAANGANDVIGLLSRKAIAAEKAAHMLEELPHNGVDCQRWHSMLRRSDIEHRAIVTNLISFAEREGVHL
jgi:DNA-binding transcriptional LysR family regulator